MRVRANPWRRTRTIVFWVIGGLLLIGLGFAAWFFLLRDTNPVPKDIRASLSFSPLVVPTDSSHFKTEQYGLSRAEDDTQILTYTIKGDGFTVKLSEYTQPSEFTEVTEYKERFLTNVVQQKKTIQTANGTIYIGGLSKQNNAEIGVMMENGLLVFMQPSRSLDDTEWRRVGESLEIRRSE